MQTITIPKITLNKPTTLNDMAFENTLLQNHTLQVNQPLPLEQSPLVASNLTPVRQIKPMYPAKARRRNIEGWVKIGFLITPENLTLLAVAYIQAQELQQAVPILEKALITTTTTVPGQLLSQIYMEQQYWKKATETLKFTLEKADKKARSELQISLGYALYEQGKIDEAKARFKTLTKNIYLNSEVKHTVQNWNRYFQSL